VEAIGASVRSARAGGFASVNLDLMYGLPGQDLPAWRDDLHRALALGTDHLSLYALTVEEGTMLHRRVARGEVVMPVEDELAGMYELASETLAREGFEHYEISNWARPGDRSVHNSGYWTGRDYLGLGAGAHGFVDGERYENIAHPRAYIDAVAAGGLPRADAYRPAGPMAMADWLSLRLRLLDGFDPCAFEAAFGVSLDAVAGPVIHQARAAGVLAEGDDRLRLTERGCLLHGELVARLLRYLEDHVPLAAAPTPL
jgi:oxygen-independent coproporphyrinogen-3 oxidase